MFGSVLNYVTLRLLGEGPNDGDGAMEKGRDWILTHGGATNITSWGKMWLSVLTSILSFYVFLNHIIIYFCYLIRLFSLLGYVIKGTWSF